MTFAARSCVCRLLLAAWPVLIQPAAAGPAAAVVVDSLKFLPPGATQLGGHLGRQIELCRDQRVLAQDVDALVKPFVTRADVTEWRGEFWGKWITSAIAAQRLAPSPALERRIQHALAELEATRTPDGYIGTYAPENRLQRWDVWSRKYTLLGFIGWFDASGDARALAAARGVADGILRDAAAAGSGFFRNDMWSGMATSSVIEPMVLLYARTGEPRYLEFCRWIVAEWQKPGGPDLIGKALAGVPVFRMFPGPDPKKEGYAGGGDSKAYEMMSCYEGLVELHRMTGEPRYAEAARSVYRSILDTEITVIGSGSDWERWSGGRRRQAEPWKMGMETCVTVTWIKFSAQLLRLTGDPAYADQIEIAAYNALLGAQSPDGTWWAHHSPLAGIKERAPEQCDMPQNCCVANGPRGLMLLPGLAVLQGGDGPVINLYGTMRTMFPLAHGGMVRLEQRSDYPVSGDIRIEVAPDAAAEFVLSLRIPAWSRETRVTVNGADQSGVEPGRYLRLKRVWQPRDVVVVALDLRPRVLEAPGAPGHFALMRGPVVLARDARLGGSVDEPVAFDFTQPAAIKFEPLAMAALPGAWMIFTARDSGGRTLQVCDFATAGNTWSDQSRYRVWSRRE